MRLHIALEDGLVAELDRRVGPQRRTALIAELVRRGLDQERWEDIESALGAIADTGHEWDDDVVGWVRSQRRGGRQANERIRRTGSSGSEGDDDQAQVTQRVVAGRASRRPAPIGPSQRSQRP